MSNTVCIRNAHTQELFAGHRYSAAAVITGWFPSINATDPNGADALERFLDAVERGSWDQDSATYLGLVEGGDPLSEWLHKRLRPDGHRSDALDSPWLITAIQRDERGRVWLSTDAPFGD
jgi:hypothetical protein